MIDKIDELFIQLNNKDELKKIPSLLILNLPGETDLKKGKLEKSDNSDELYVFATNNVGEQWIFGNKSEHSI